MAESYSNIRQLLNCGATPTVATDSLPGAVIQEKTVKEERSRKPAEKGRRLDSLVEALREKQTKRGSQNSQEHQPLAKKFATDTSQQISSTSKVAELLSQKPSPPVRNTGGEFVSSSSLVALLNSHNSKRSNDEHINTIIQPAKELTAPKLSRHNDAAYYPNIQCILCQEWVCSRNRYMHIESHLQYRPYRCSQCGYDNRKEIFINLHIKRSHKGHGNVVYNPQPDLEHRAWVIAEQCIQHTRKVLMKQAEVESKEGKNPDPLDPSILQSYKEVYRPKIYNSQRAEKSQLIEESRQLGLVPDFSEVADREERCHTCGSHILRINSMLEEHVRTHLQKPSYRCNIDGCQVEHQSKNFISRHMKEVHKYRRPPVDLLEDNPQLIHEYQRLCQRSFPEFFDLDTITRIRCRYTHQTTVSNNNYVLGELLKKKDSLSLSSPSSSSSSADQDLGTSAFQQICAICNLELCGDYTLLYEHAKTHLKTPPFQCSLCGFSGTNKKTILLHIFQVHKASAENGGSMVRSGFTPAVSLQCEMLINACFPDVPVRKNLHDPIEQVCAGTTSICRLCRKETRDKISHAEYHLYLPILKCHFCAYKQSDETAMKEHTRSEHQSDLYLVATPSKSMDRLSQIEIMKDECFVKD